MGLLSANLLPRRERDPSFYDRKRALENFFWVMHRLKLGTAATTYTYEQFAGNLDWMAQKYDPWLR
jgi:hypothetical protein